MALGHFGVLSNTGVLKNPHFLPVQLLSLLYQIVQLSRLVQLECRSVAPLSPV